VRFLSHIIEGPKIKIKAALFLLFFLVMMTSFLRVNADDPPTTKWNKTYGGSRSEMAYCAQQTIDGGYFIAGYTSSFGAGAADFWLVKTNSSGNLQWNKTYGRANQDEAYAAQQTTDTGYILAGSTSSIETGLLDFWLVKTDSNGQELWNNTYGGSQEDVAYSVDQTADGGYIVAGSTDSFGSGNADFWLVKTDSEGQMQWNKTYGGFYDEVGYSVQQTTDGGYAVCGYTGSLGAGYEDFWLVKTDSDGNPEWNKTYGGIDSEYAYFLQQTSDYGYIIAGSTYSLTTEFDMWLVKADSSGNMQWNKTIGGSLDEEAYGVRQTNDGGYVIAGFTDSFGNNREVYVIKTDSSGSIEWAQTYGGAQKDEACAVEQTSDGGYIVAGTTYSFGPSWDPNFWLIRLAGLHDIGVQNVVPHKTVVGKGYSVFINITFKNWGQSEETFDFTVYANTTNIGTQHLTLANGNSITITFTWNTTGFAKGNYTIWAYAWPVQNETDTTDNRLTDGWVLITKVGDLGSRVGSTNEFGVCDGLVTSTDLSLFLQCYKATAPTAYMYLGDLGSRVGTTNKFFACDGSVTSTDLNLFLQCYKGTGP
jgi:predicted secreted protein